MSGFLKAVAKNIPVIGGVLGNIFNASSQNKQNQASQAFSREMYGKQRADALSDWNMQNAYNDPSAQMQRLSSAGLNPNLVYGNGADAQSSSSVRSSNVESPTFKAPQVDVGGVVQSAMMTKQLQANIARTEAETERIKTDTQAMLYQNRMLTPDMFAQEYQHRYNKGQYGAANEENNSHMIRLQTETANLLNGYRREHGSGGNYQTNKPTSNLNVEKLTSDIQAITERTAGEKLTNALKEYETNLIKSFGVSGNHAATIMSNILKLIMFKH